MINPKKMTPDRWKSLLDEAGLKLDEVEFVISHGPVLISKDSEKNLVIVTEEHWEHLNKIWKEVEDLYE